METKTELQLTTKSLFAREDVKNKITEMLGKRSTAFITSVLSVVQNNAYLKNAKPETIYTSAMIAATLDLPIHPSLGMAYLIPYGDQCQFQIGYKGIIQLALRSGQFKTISACPVYEGQLLSENPLTGYVFDFSKKTSDKIVGYAAYFSLINGFEKNDYWTVEKVKEHGKKFSKTFTSKGGVWEKDFDSMAKKTVLKLLLSTYAPKTVEMQRAIIADQAVINDVETLDVDYVDEGKSDIQVEDLEMLFDIKKEALTPAEIKDAERIIKNKEVASYQKLLTQLQAK